MTLTSLELLSFFEKIKYGFADLFKDGTELKILFDIEPSQVKMKLWSIEYEYNLFVLIPKIFFQIEVVTKIPIPMI